MDYFSAIILGLVQGLTEFLPVSSSGHLVLAEYLLGIKRNDVGFELILHLGSLLAILIFFRRDIGLILKSLLPAQKVSTAESDFDGRRWLLMMILACVPTALIGVAFSDQFVALFGMPHVDAFMLWITGLILVASDRIKVSDDLGSNQKIRVHQALIVGVAQGVSIIPGISRSGATISAGLFSGLNRPTAARFSFLLSIPAIFGAGLFEHRAIAEVSTLETGPAMAGTLISFLTSFIAINLLLKLVVKRRLWTFAVYLFFIGLLELVITR
ncbi:MAG TPA: undecaprenyl-diphosphate phosphatase [bacterium]|jgi:undecaprenyl-diphosphatase